MIGFLFRDKCWIFLLALLEERAEREIAGKKI